MNITGGLAIHTTLNMRDQLAADHAVDSVLPAHNNGLNPGHLADTEVLIIAGQGKVRAIAVNRHLRHSGLDRLRGQHAVRRRPGRADRLVIEALHADHRAGAGLPVRPSDHDQVACSSSGPTRTVTAGTCRASCSTMPKGAAAGSQVWPLYLATVDSINIYFAHLEQQVGLCNVVKTAVKMGMTRADGRSLLKPDKSLASTALRPTTCRPSPSARSTSRR